MPVETVGREAFDATVSELLSAGLTKPYIARVCGFSRKCLEPRLHARIAASTQAALDAALPSLRRVAEMDADERDAAMRRALDGRHGGYGAPSGYVDARSVRALMRSWTSRGVPQRLIATRCGLSPNAVCKILSGKRKHVHATTAVAVYMQKDYFDELASCGQDDIDLETAVSKPAKRRTCRRCGRRFNDYGTGNRSYCSRECRHAADRERRKEGTARIDASHARKVLSAYRESGGSIPSLAARHGLSRHTLHKIVSGKQKEVTRKTWPKIEACLAEIEGRTIP